MVIADVFRPDGVEKRKLARIYDVAVVVSASLLVALSAQAAVRFPFSPVPVTGQTFAVLLAGFLLGSRRGALAIFTYLAQGAAGFPVFAGGASGLAYLFGPTGGYLVGFVPAAFVVGFLAEMTWDRKIALTALAMLIGNIVIYLFGLPWLGFFVGFNRVLHLGLYPFIAGDVLKIMLAMMLLPCGWRILRSLGYPK